MMMHEYGAPALTPWRGSLKERIQQAIDYADFLHPKTDNKQHPTRVMLAAWGTDGPLIEVQSGDTVDDVLSHDGRPMKWPDDSNTVQMTLRSDLGGLRKSLGSN